MYLTAHTLSRILKSYFVCALPASGANGHMVTLILMTRTKSRAPGSKLCLAQAGIETTLLSDTLDIIIAIIVIYVKRSTGKSNQSICNDAKFAYLLALIQCHTLPFRVCTSLGTLSPVFFRGRSRRQLAMLKYSLCLAANINSVMYSSGLSFM